MNATRSFIVGGCLLLAIFMASDIGHSHRAKADRVVAGGNCCDAAAGDASKAMPKAATDSDQQGWSAPGTTLADVLLSAGEGPPPNHGHALPTPAFSSVSGDRPNLPFRFSWYDERGYDRQVWGLPASGGMNHTGRPFSDHSSTDGGGAPGSVGAPAGSAAGAPPGRGARTGGGPAPGPGAFMPQARSMPVTDGIPVAGVFTPPPPARRAPGSAPGVADAPARSPPAERADPCLGTECGATPVPEPGSLALFVAGLAGIAGIRRRRKS